MIVVTSCACGYSHLGVTGSCVIRRFGFYRATFICILAIHIRNYLFLGNLDKKSN